MPKVITTDYYDAWEEAPPLTKLRDGMKIFVKWPDKSVTVEMLKIRQSWESEQIDMSGGPDRFKTQRLVIVQNVHGVKVDVSLKGLEISLKRS